MTRSLLEIVQDAADTLSLARPSSVIGSNDDQVRQMLGHAQREGRELYRRYEWEALINEHTFTSVAAEAQTSGFPDPNDYDRMVPETFYNRDKTRAVQGPLTPSDGQDYKARTTSLVYDAFRIRGGTLLINPTPAAGESYAYEYVSKNWCTTADGATGQTKWTADTDIPVLDDEIFVLGLIWRFLKGKSLEYGEAFNTYQLHVKAVTGRDGAVRKLSLGASNRRFAPIPPMPPDGSWPL